MRSPTSLVLAALLLAPLAASIPALPVAPLPPDLSDAALLRLLAARSGHDLHVPRLTLAPDDTLEALTLRLAARAGATLTSDERAQLHALDPRIAAPTLALLAAIEQAWDLRDQAYAALPADDLARLRVLDPTSEEAARIAAAADMRPMYEAAILLLDTLDAHALPALQDAARSVPWPATPLVDNPVLRLGGTGDDAITSDRILQIDPRGNDLYRNNAGASTLLDPATLLQTPIALSIDLDGNDTYDRRPTQIGDRPPAQGSGIVGVGILLDLAGHDSYVAARFSQGAAAYGIGLLRDVAGGDRYDATANAAGWSAGGPGILRDDGGDDGYVVGADSGGAATGAPVVLERTYGLLWDRAGRDEYATKESANDRYGWVRSSGSGWLADEGESSDIYHTALNPSNFQHGCNDCEWWAGFHSPPLGRGVDNAGGLAHLLATGLR